MPSGGDTKEPGRVLHGNCCILRRCRRPGFAVQALFAIRFFSSASIVEDLDVKGTQKDFPVFRGIRVDHGKGLKVRF